MQIGTPRVTAPKRRISIAVGSKIAWSRRTFLSAVGMMPVARLAAQAPTFSAGVKVVNVLATVRDKQGRIVKGLNADDFSLDEDGRRQAITYFSRESDLPLTLGLLVDTSGSQRRVLPEERSASYRFFDQVLREGKDQAFLIHFDYEVELLEDLTSSRQRLEEALDDLDTTQSRRWRVGYPGGGGGYPGGGGGYPGTRRYPGGGSRGMGGGTTLYDAVLLASDNLMKKQTGRKALVVLSDGVDTGSRVPLASAVESAQRADTLVYSVLFADPEAYNGGPRMGRHGGMGMPVPGRRYNLPDGKAVLEQISRETGGRFFEVSEQQPIQSVFQAIEEDLRNQYSLGYTPDRADANDLYHRIHVTTRQKDLAVQAREGYYGS